MIKICVSYVKNKCEFSHGDKYIYLKHKLFNTKIQQIFYILPSNVY